MDYSVDILARLQAGENVEDIANELTKSINDAKTKYDAEVHAAEAERMAAKRETELHEEKIAVVENLFDSIADVLEVWGVEPDIVEGMIHTDRDELEDIVQSVDALLPVLQSQIAMQNELSDTLSKLKQKRETQVAAKKDPIEDFLNQFVR